MEDDEDFVSRSTVPTVDTLCSCGGEEAMMSDGARSRSLKSFALVKSSGILLSMTMTQRGL